MKDIEQKYIDRFFDKIEKTNSCWYWTGAINRGGYGQLSIQGKSYKAHRLAWMIKYGDIPTGMCVLHKCDVTECVNPDHLFIGTHIDNVRDMVSKGRQSRGKEYGRKVSKSDYLEDWEVEEIQERLNNNNYCGLANYLAEYYDVSPMLISLIKHNKHNKNTFSRTRLKNLQKKMSRKYMIDSHKINTISRQ